MRLARCSIALAIARRAPAMMAEDRSRRRSLLGRLAGVAVVVAFLALLAYGLAARAPDTGIDDGLARAQAVTAPAAELPVLQGGASDAAPAPRLDPALADGRLGLDELRGTPVVLNFWASWCVPCRVEAPLLERGWRTARREGTVFVGLNMQDITDDARNFMREFRVSYPNVRDPTNRVARRWGVTGLPETFFISSQGRVVGHVIGVVSPAQLRRGLAAARAGRPTGTLQGGARRPTR